MPGNIYPRDDLDSRFRELEDRLRRLETGLQDGARSQIGGTNTLFQSDGTTHQQRSGYFIDGDGAVKYGWSLYDGKGDIMIYSNEDDDGLIFPHQPVPFGVPSNALTTTSATFTAYAETYQELVVHDTLSFLSNVSVPAGTVAEYRLYDLIDAAQIGNVLSITGAGSGYIACDWLHNKAVGWGDPATSDMFVSLQHRRVSGGGTVTSYFPIRTMLRNSAFANGNESATDPLRKLF